MPVTITDDRPDELVEALYKPLLSDLPPDRKYMLLALCNVSDKDNINSPYEDREGRVRRDIRIGSHNITLICTDLNALPSFCPFAARQRMSRWAQDAFIALENDASTILLKPVESMIDAADNRAEFFTADFLALAANMLIRPFGCRVQGGDVLVGDTYALIGRRTLAANRRSAHSCSPGEEQSIAEQFRRALGVQHLIPIGGSGGGGELHHIDYYLTPGGKNKRGEEVLFVGRVGKDCLFTADNETIRARAGQVRAQYNAYLDGVAESVRELSATPGAGVKFEVVRLPLILDYFRRGECVVRPYNNCLVEVYGTEKNAYLPCYAEDDGTGANIFGPVEQQTRSVLEQYGFCVTMVHDNFCNISRQGGSLRCMVKELGRSGAVQ